MSIEIWTKDAIRPRRGRTSSLQFSANQKMVNVEIVFTVFRSMHKPLFIPDQSS